MIKNLLPEIKLGMSICASWAWGTSLIVGMQTVQQKGLLAWLIWFIANTLTLLLFGWLYHKGILGRHVFNKKIVKWLAIGIQCICLIVQLNIINSVLISMNVNPQVSIVIASSIGWLFTLLMYKHGLSTSIWTDCWQLSIAFITCICLISYGLYFSIPHIEWVSSSINDVLWGIWSACILLSGPIGDMQHWQRAEEDKSKRAFKWSCLIFTIYLLFVLALAVFQFDFVMNLILLITVLCITTSTIDSIAVALHEISNKLVGTIVSLFICSSWFIFTELGIIELWSKAGVYRVLFALFILGLAYYSIQVKHNGVK